MPVVKYAKINFLHFAIFLFVVSIMVQVFVSLTDKSIQEKSMSIFAGKGERAYDTTVNGRWLDIALSILLVAIIIALWVIFSPIFIK